MRRSLYALVSAFCFMACAGSQQADVSGTLSGVCTDTLVVQSYEIKVSGERDMKYDTVIMKDGQFAFSVGDRVLKQVCIMEKPMLKVGETAYIPKWMSFILLPGKPVRIDGTFDNYTLSGDAFYDGWTECQTAVREYKAKIDSLQQFCFDLCNQGVSEDSILKVYRPALEWERQMNELKADYIEKHLDQDVSVYLLSQTPMKIVTEMIDKIGKNVQSGVMSPLYQDLKRISDDEKERKSTCESILKEGTPAKDFTLKDIQGKNFTLSSLKGKYAVLYFWGIWYGECMNGIPEMKKYYEKYKGKLEIVGINCDDAYEEWKLVVESENLPWINVRDEGDPDVEADYGIQTHPTKIVIDKDGHIAKVVVGEDPAFYRYLDSLMK